LPSGGRRAARYAPPVFRPLAWLLLLSIASCDGGCDSSAETKEVAAPSATVTNGLPALPAEPREAFLARSIGTLLTSQHLLQKPLDDSVSRAAFEAYLARLDGGKLFLLAPQVAALRKLDDQLDDQVQSGDLLLARQGEALLKERRKVVGLMVADILSKSFDFSPTESIETDPEKLDYAPDEAALRDRWRKVLKLQVLQRIAAMEDGEKRRGDDHSGAGGEPPVREEVPTTPEGREAKAREKVATSYQARFKRLEEGDPLGPAERFLGAVTSVYDPHSTYLAPAEQANFDIEISGSLEGIGALLGVKDHLVEVRELVPGGASWRQGKLEPGDLILAVGAEGQEMIEIADMPLDRVVSLIRGPKGTVVTLRVQKPEGRIENIAITRDVIVIEAAYARGAVLDLPDHPAMGYIHLPGFYGNTRGDRGATGERNASDDVRKLLVIFEQKKLPGVLIDLRGNGGGLLAHARDITGHFIETGPVVQVRTSDGTTDVVRDDDPSVAFSGEVVVLVDRFSASASEIVAGALQDYDRAIIVGTGPTHGKGTVQILVELERLRGAPSAPLGILKLTTQQFFLVEGDSTQSRGVEPDIVLPDPSGFMESGERFLDHAIPWRQIDALPHADWRPTWDRAALSAASQKRVAEEKLFGAVAERNRLLEARRKDTVAPLERTAWRERQKRDDDAAEALRDKLEEGRARFEVESIDYNGTTGERDERIEKQIARWRTDLSRDVWVAEALRVLGDMAATR
jgi:carboxyl-terminal processing protease